MTTTQALVVDEINGPFSVQEVTLADLRDNEVLVEIEATGLCHTDLSCANGTFPIKFPAVLGHEGKSQIPQIYSFQCISSSMKINNHCRRRSCKEDRLENHKSRSRRQSSTVLCILRRL